ncbi:MAG: hypothetical protein KTR30_38985 [Saprospiraceae bacterium]|nr:hypothetical protein [Saprospiraceae bacterium]
MKKPTLLVLLLIGLGACRTADQSSEKSPVQVSGIYPHLAHYNQEGECGTGAVVPWADRLWVITYAPHFPRGSSDKLYEITSDLRQIVRAESIGGTPANRMIHTESQQLFIGPYAIGAEGKVRRIPYDVMPGRHTGNARHLEAPSEKLYYATMEEGFYSVDAQSLQVETLFKDGHENGKRLDYAPGKTAEGYAGLPGAHGKGLYSGQGVLVYSNNGETSPEAMKQFDIESGVLAEWDGKKWKTIRRSQFVEVTGPGGIYGNPKPETDPIWVTGWDHKSVLVGVRGDGDWSFFRLPKASHSYDGAHGWNTEWPRIRNIGTGEAPDYLMTMHGMFWSFPANFTRKNTQGIRPRSAYLKVIGDFTRWKEQLVFGCDDSAQKEFLNKRPQKGGIEGPGQSNSNLWFTSLDTPDKLGPTTASGAVWMEEEVESDVYSLPFLLAGWPNRQAWLKNHSEGAVELDFEIDRTGKGQWEEWRRTRLSAGESLNIKLESNVEGEWIRAKSNRTAKLSLLFNFSAEESRSSDANAIFSGLAGLEEEEVMGGLLYGLGDDRRALGLVAQTFTKGGAPSSTYYELDAALNLRPASDQATETFIKEKFAIPKEVIEVASSSVLITDIKGRRWRLPKREEQYTELTKAGHLRICREVATERDLFSCHGTFYELPAENADGFAKIRPIATHSYRIHDYASYRGLLVMTGISATAQAGSHLVRSADGKAAVWLGTIDDLWKMGKPTGKGGPWLDTAIEADEYSDPYLIGFYDQRELSLRHDAAQTVHFTVEVQPLGHGPWITYQEFEVPAGETFKHQFPTAFEARWIRFKADTACAATAWLIYQ